MILFFGKPKNSITALQIETKLEATAIEKLVWLFDDPWLNKESISGTFIGPRATMITPWSTNAVEITQNMGIQGIIRIEQFTPLQNHNQFDPMLFEKYKGLSTIIFDVNIDPESLIEIKDISS